MKKVVCINDKNLPPGAEVSEGKEYEVMEVFNNMLDQRTYILKGICNHGYTIKGMFWRGYRAERFVDTDKVYSTEHEVQYQLN